MIPRRGSHDARCFVLSALEQLTRETRVIWIPTSDVEYCLHLRPQGYSLYISDVDDVICLRVVEVDSLRNAGEVQSTDFPELLTLWEYVTMAA